MEQTSKVHVRVYHDLKDKRTFLKETLPDFPRLSSIKEVKRSLYDIFKEKLPNSCNADNLEVGIIGRSNVKRIIKEDSQLDLAHSSGSVHKDGNVIWYVTYNKTPADHERPSCSLEILGGIFSVQNEKCLTKHSLLT